MSEFGVKASWKKTQLPFIPDLYKPTLFLVESDWSAASYWYEIASLSDKAEIELLGLFQDSSQRQFESGGIISGFRRFDRIYR